MQALLNDTDIVRIERHPVRFTQPRVHYSCYYLVKRAGWTSEKMDRDQCRNYLVQVGMTNREVRHILPLVAQKGVYEWSRDL